ncbi:hypothetical protein BMS3Abin03_01893 [bacterium BMS3Abin03]|nr:hypothetical protein BMS3Abin03_01893 [bacterium BMS3Abin03]
MKNKLILEYFNKIKNANKEAAKFIEENLTQHDSTATHGC